MKFIKLTNSNENVIIDDEDYDRINSQTWRLQISKTGKGIRATNGGEALADFILNTKSNMYIQIDHIDRDIFNNQKENLRSCTKSANCMNRSIAKNNTSGHKGIYWHKTKQKWQVTITFNGRSKHLGYFYSKERAITIYNEAASKYFGEFNAKLPNQQVN